MEKYERDARNTLFEKLREEAVIFKWYEEKIEKLNDSHKSRADLLRKLLRCKEDLLMEKIEKMPFSKVMEGLGC